MDLPPARSTPRLLLRGFVPDDAPATARLCADRAIADTTLVIPHPYTLEDAVTWIASHGSGRESCFAVIEAASGNLLGSIGLRIERAHDRAELGYWIGRPFWGRGYATEAACEVLRWGFAEQGLNRIYAYHFARNPASGRVLEKLGMRHEGRLRALVKKWEVYEDCHLYAALRADGSSPESAPAGHEKTPAVR